jgi:uncharacterized oligopeptide transporter (OPT) family protein
LYLLGLQLLSVKSPATIDFATLLNIRSGMYVPPAISLPRVAGAFVILTIRYCTSINKFVAVCAASGMILGEGIFSIVTLMFKVWGVPHL